MDAPNIESGWRGNGEMRICASDQSIYRYRYGDMVNIVGVDDQTCSCGHQLFSSSKLEFSYFPTLLLFSQVGEEASWQK